MKLTLKFLLVLLIIIPSLSRAQMPYVTSKPVLNSLKYLFDLEAGTYRLYTEQKWDSLLTTGKTAINSHLSNYYILVRTATAAYYLERYSLAIKYLLLAKEIGPSNTYVDELLFYSYLYSGRKLQAQSFANSLPLSIKNRLISGNFCPSVFLESGPVLFKKINPMTGLESDLYNDRITDKDGFYFLIGYRHPARSWWTINASFSTVLLNKMREVNIKYLDTLKGDYDVKQSEYFISSDILLSNKFIITPAFNIASTDVSDPIKSNDSIVNLYLGPSLETNYKNYVAGGEVSYNEGFWSATAGAWYLDLNNKKSYQTLASLMVMPKGNLNLYSSTSLIFLPQRMKEPFVISEMAGFKVSNNIWMELSGTLGNLAGTVEKNGQLINNQVSKTSYRLESLVILDISKAIRLTVRYQFTENELMYFTLNSENSLKQPEYSSNKHVITGGITWHIL